MTPRRSLLLVVPVCLCIPMAGRALQAPTPPPPRIRREIPGFDFRKDGVWRRQARAVRAARHRLLATRNFPALNAPLQTGGRTPLSGAAPQAAGPVVSGQLRVPAIVFKYKDTPAAQVRTTPEFDQVLFAPSPTGASAGRPYTYASYYAEISNGLLTVSGATFGYAALDSNEVTYTGLPGSCTGNPYPGSTDCNGLFSNNAVSRMQAGLLEALRKVDAQVDWTQYDRDGDGFVDLVAFIQPTIDGACGPIGNNHLWSHRFFLGPYKTHSVNALGDTIRVADYILESGVGGSSGCDSTHIMPIGTVAHETGHGFGLPDLYDTDGLSEGVGEYSLMGSGNYTAPYSPSRIDPWSLNELGWITVAPDTTSGPFSFGPTPTSDTVFFVPVKGANPRGEYFLLENRQPVQTDSAMLHYHCRVWYATTSPPPSCGGGVVVWHVDSEQISQHGFDVDNRVNAGPIHGLEVVQADAFGNLDADATVSCKLPPRAGCSDRGDAGDLYPGPTGNTTLAISTTPSDGLNTGGCPGFRIDSIAAAAPAGVQRFVLTFQGDSLSVTTDPVLASGKWGYSYALQLRAACGSGSYTWSLVSGAPPPGMTLSSGGVLSGAPSDTGTYSFQANVTDGTHTASRGMTLSVTEPTLTQQQVLNLAFQGQATLGDDQRRYLDAQGNNDGIFDLGDVLRWLARNGKVTLPAPPLRAARARP